MDDSTTKFFICYAFAESGQCGPLCKMAPVFLETGLVDHQRPKRTGRWQEDGVRWTRRQGDEQGKYSPEQVIGKLREG